MTVYRVVWAEGALRDAGARLLGFTRGGPPLHREEQAVYAAIDALRTAVGDDEDDPAPAEPVNTCAPDSFEVRVDRFVVSDAAAGPVVELTWSRNGWELTSSAMPGIHLFVGADDVNHTGPAFDRARKLLAELRQLAGLRQQAAAIEAELQDQDVPF